MWLHVCPEKGRMGRLSARQDVGIRQPWKERGLMQLVMASLGHTLVQRRQTTASARPAGISRGARNLWTKCHCYLQTQSIIATTTPFLSCHPPPPPAHPSYAPTVVVRVSLDSEHRLRHFSATCPKLLSWHSPLAGSDAAGSES